MSYSIREKLQAEVLRELADVGLHPIADPLGENHHTDVPTSEEDKFIGDKLAYFLGGLFVDVEHLGPAYFYDQMTSVDVWQRVARALRIHGLRIVDAPPSGHTTGTRGGKT